MVDKAIIKRGYISTPLLFKTQIIKNSGGIIPKITSEKKKIVKTKAVDKSSKYENPFILFIST